MARYSEIRAIARPTQEAENRTDQSSCSWKVETTATVDPVMPTNPLRRIWGVFIDESGSGIIALIHSYGGPVS